MSRWAALLVIMLQFPCLADEVEPAQIAIPHWNLNPLVRERGFLLGFLVDSRVDGVIIKTVEGQFQMGFASTNATFVDPNCIADREGEVRTTIPEAPERMEAYHGIPEECTRPLNPRRFSSSDVTLQEELATLKGGPILIYYLDYRFVIFPLTRQILTKVWRVDPNRKDITKSLDEIGHFYLGRLLHKARGKIDGRIVRAALVGNVRENYEVTIQIGPSGNNFTVMNISSSSLYDHVVRLMATGNYLRIYYLWFFHFQEAIPNLFHNYQTNYRVYRVDVLDPPDLEPGAVLQ